MPTEIEVHAAIDTLTNAEIETTAGIPVVYGNQSNVSLSGGTIAFLTQRVIFTNDNQLGLGNTASRKHLGSLIFIIHCRKGTGDFDRNRLQAAVVNSFRSRVVGGATLLNAKSVAQGDTDNWTLSGIQIPFYFFEL